MGAERELVMVLLVHPDAVVHDLVSTALGDEFRILTATTGARALTLFERHKPPVVVLESDIGDEHAEDLYAQMSRHEPELRVVFFADQEDPKRALRLADLGTVLSKKRDVERLRAALRNAVRFRALSEDVARLKDDAARAGTTTAKRKQEAAGETAGPRSRRSSSAPRATTPEPRSPSLVDIEPFEGPPSRGRR